MRRISSGDNIESNDYSNIKLEIFPEMLLTDDPRSENLEKAWKFFPGKALSDKPIFGDIWILPENNPTHDIQQIYFEKDG